MTPEERSAITRHGFIYGLWIVLSLGLPVHFLVTGLLTGNLAPVLGTICGLLVVAHLVGIPIWQRRQRQFLASTVWAREQGIEADSLKLFRFGSSK